MIKQRLAQFIDSDLDNLLGPSDSPNKVRGPIDEFLKSYIDVNFCFKN